MYSEDKSDPQAINKGENFNKVYFTVSVHCAETGQHWGLILMQCCRIFYDI